MSTPNTGLIYAGLKDWDEVIELLVGKFGNGWSSHLVPLDQLTKIFREHFARRRVTSEFEIQSGYHWVRESVQANYTDVPVLYNSIVRGSSLPNALLCQNEKILKQGHAHLYHWS